MRKMTSAKPKIAARLSPLVPMQQSRLEKEKVESNKWIAKWGGDPDGTRFEVCHHETRINVDLQNQSFTCRQLTGISLHDLNLSIMDFMYCISMKIVLMCISLPCRHVAIRYNNHILEDYNDGMLTIGSYNATYENYIRPTRSQQYWETTPFDRSTPLHIKKRPSRPKKCRRKDQNEGQVSNSRLKRSYKEVTCTRCGLNGHNSGGCINGGVSPRPKK